MDNKWIIKIINYGAIALYLDFNIYSLLHVEFIDSNPLLWKVIAGEHHVIDFFGILFCFFVLLPMFYKNPKTRKIYALIAFFTNYFLISFHEMLWYATFYAEHLFTNTYFNPDWFTHGKSFYAYIVIITAFFILSNRGAYKLPIRMILVLGIYYLFWLGLGFPVTVDYNGFTPYYFNLDVNILEIVSWIIPIFMLPIEQHKYITMLVNKNKSLSEQKLTTTDFKPLKAS